ncbi:M28 family metallopeptidase [Galbibacter sp. EGI 63066]|uniref:M28 family metallopeptidase n=1 Tax=Galbibacter sp. EGI 63066 TaxID=2993559 RepID=UPI002249522B|nr:M28 family metallopeptidase [Galbibacter sp. EGI 63066]MCX2679315.1 M28 family metallopeptidase [Galbibacter sp. EGI 63066]
MKKILYVGLFFALACNSARQDANTPSAEVNTTETSRVSYANTITEEELKEHLYTYASDEFEGRETGEPGQKKAVEYLKKEYLELGIPAAKGNDDYFQKVPLEISGIPSGSIKIGDSDYALGDGIITFSSVPNQSYDIVYAGFGIETDVYSDYSNVDVSGKYVLIKIGEPKNEDGTYTFSGTNEPSKWSNWRETLGTRIETAHKNGAAGILYYDDTYFSRAMGRYQHYLQADNGGSISLKSNEEKPAYFFINEEVATTIYPEINTSNNSKVLDQKIKLDLQNKVEDVDSENVVAVIKGKSKPEEYLVISAHLDHVGVDPNGNVFNGADDDGSGTVAILEIAEAFKKAADEGNGPERSIVFLHVTGEEKGLLGSEYYSENPIFPIKQTVADLNIDMIGRIDPKRDGERNYIYLIGSDKLSTELHNLSEAVNKKYTNIELDYTYNDENDPNRFYYRSDHYNFAKHNVPIIFYFNGTHADYHKISDTPDKINYDLLTNRTQLIFHTAWEVANRAERVKVDKPKATE